MNFIEELQWRGLVQDMIPGTDEMLSNEKMLSKIKKDQENNERLLRSYMTESKPQEINIKQILDIFIL